MAVGRLMNLLRYLLYQVPLDCDPVPFIQSNVVAGLLDPTRILLIHPHHRNHHGLLAFMWSTGDAYPVARLEVKPRILPKAIRALL